MTITSKAKGSRVAVHVHKANTSSPKNALRIANLNLPSGKSLQGCFYMYNRDKLLKIKSDIALDKMNSPTPAP